VAKVGVGGDGKGWSRKLKNRRRIDRSTLPEGERPESKSRLSEFHIFAGPGDDETGVNISDVEGLYVDDVARLLVVVVVVVFLFNVGLSFTIPGGHQNGFTVHLRNCLLKKRETKCLKLVFIVHRKSRFSHFFKVENAQKH
jgi:hypothetical protein